MMSQRSPFGASIIEVLEARIAPAIILVGAPDSVSNDSNYDESGSPFVNLETAPGSDPIVQALGRGAAGVQDTFYLKLSAGDTVRIYKSGGYQEFMKVTSGQVMAFFVDRNGDNEVQEDELVSLALGKNAAVSLASGIAGDIVSNLKPDWSLDMSNGVSGLVSDSQSIKSVTVGLGDIVGNVIAGGDINRVVANGRVGGILTGSAANGVAFDFFPDVEGGEGTISFTPTAGKKGGSIKNIFVDGIGFNSSEGRIEAGSGGAGAAGGSLSNIRISEDFDGFSLKAGNGGNALGSAKAGAGGNVSKVYISGLPDLTQNDLISIFAGDGGDSVTGKGGKGGAASDIYVGFDLVGKKPIPSVNVLFDNVEIGSGEGGDGRTGGAGGNISKVRVTVTAPDLQGSDEISLIAGKGGNNIDATGGKAGVGGSVSNVILSELHLGAGASIAVQAGDGGNATALGKGAAGGSVTKSTFLSDTVSVLAGNGSEGTSGGAGGSLSNLVLDQASSVIPHVAVFNAGFGGNGTDGNGGKGGDVTKLRVTEGDFTQFDLNSGAAGNGGNSVGGKGGKGGSINQLELVDNDLANSQFTGTATLRAGIGGSGSNGAGAGGSIKSSMIVAEDLNLLVSTGNGGSVTGNGNGRGGNGGVIQKTQIITSGETALDVPANVSVVTGTGGDGLGYKGKGGNGGDYVSVLIRADGSASAIAGNGGNGADASGVGNAAGNGGSLRQTGAFAKSGDGAFIAGDAGVAGTKPGKGGSIVGNGSRLTGLYAAGDLTLKAGNGSNGGAGGSITHVGYGSTQADLTPTPVGNILVKAGDGSAEGKFAGAGGSIKKLTGAVSSGSGTTTLIYAGVGGGGADKSANGGSIVDVRIERGGSPVDAPLTELRILGGDAGNGGVGVAKGAKGGDVRDVKIFNLNVPTDSGAPTDTLIRSIAAGRGGDAAKVGGAGGTLDKIRVLDHDIGVRFGEVYGYETMGGLFAGEGGAASTQGKAGNVTNITARAIAAIVAGRGAMPEMVEKVENVYLFKTAITGQRVVDLLEAEPDPLNPLVSDLNLDEANSEDPGDPNYYAYNLNSYLTNNFVGATADPLRVDGNKFSFNDLNENGRWDFADGETPIDGLVAAKIFNQNKVNFTPEARLIGETREKATFFDYDNRKVTLTAPVV